MRRSDAPITARPGHQAGRLDAVRARRRPAAQGRALRRAEVVEQPVQLRPRLLVAAGQVHDRPVAAPHQPVGAEDVQREVQEGPQVLRGPVGEVGPGREQAGHLGEHVRVGRGGAQVVLPAGDPRRVAADRRLREVVDDQHQARMPLREDRHELEVPPPYGHDVERDAARLEQREPLADVRPQQPLGVGLEVDRAAHAAERAMALDLLQPARRVGRPVERQPRHDGADGRLRVRDLEHVVGVRVVLGRLHHHGAIDAGGPQERRQLLELHRAVDRAEGVRQPGIRRAGRIPQMVVSIDQHRPELCDGIL